MNKLLVFCALLFGGAALVNQSDATNPTTTRRVLAPVGNTAIHTAGTAGLGKATSVMGHWEERVVCDGGVCRPQKVWVNGPAPTVAASTKKSTVTTPRAPQRSIVVRRARSCGRFGCR